jgi:TctA family transporter
VGIAPGVGAGTAVWVAYGQAKQTSKHPEEYGKGSIEGLIAVQSAANSSLAGDLLTTMCFGIPGSSSCAILLGAFVLVGITPGPTMVDKNLDMIFALFAGIAIANIMGGLICMGTASYLTRIAFIPMDFMFPIIVAIILVAAVATEEALWDLAVVALSGFLGLAMKRFGYSLAALALGFVLGDLFEYYFFMSLKLSGPLFFLKPTCLLMIAILVLLFTYRYLVAGMKRWIERKSVRNEN